MTVMKQASPELLSLIKAAAQGLQAFGTLWESIKKKGYDEGFSEPELQDILRPLLRDNLGMTKDKVYYLFHREERNQQSTEYHRQTSVKSATDDAKKGLEQSDTPTPKPEIAKVENIDTYKEEPEEDPKDTEIQFLKEENAQLKGALKQATEFKPASQQIGFTKDTSEFSSVTFRMGVKDFTRAKEFISKEMSEYISKEFSAMKNRGWAVVEVVIKVV